MATDDEDGVHSNLLLVPAENPIASSNLFLEVIKSDLNIGRERTILLSKIKFDESLFVFVFLGNLHTLLVRGTVYFPGRPVHMEMKNLAE